MKRCPKCNVDYFDNMLEFCLEDGTKLLVVSEASGSSAAAKTGAARARSTVEETISFEAPIVPPAPRPLEKSEIETVVTRGLADEAAAPYRSNSTRALEIAPIVLALMHNWWQWLYLENQYVSSIASYVFSANFLMWLVLLGAGIALSLKALKSLQDKAFAYISLVILAINLLLFLVPRK
jgi:hypothetical protein